MYPDRQLARPLTMVKLLFTRNRVCHILAYIFIETLSSLESSIITRSRMLASWKVCLVPPEVYHSAHYPK